jgi:hypothetical protein
MKYLKSQMILESVDKQLVLSGQIIAKLKEQNPIISDAEDILLEINDSWGFTVTPNYVLLDSTNPANMPQLDLWTTSAFDYFGMGEGDFDEPEEDYKWSKVFLDNIRTGKTKSLILEIQWQYANESNNFEYLKQTNEQKEIFNEVKERLESLGCVVSQSPSVVRDIDYSGLWSINIKIPVKLQLDAKISKLDSLPTSIIKDFEQFIKDYNIDSDGQVKLSNLIRKINLSKD